MKTSIQTISIIGPGAMGAIYASILFDMDRNCVSFIAGGERYERLIREGLIINGKQYSIPLLRPEQKAAPADLLIVAVKHHDLDGAIRNMKNRVGAGTSILSVMNGIESEERIGAAYGVEKVLYAVPVGMDATRAGNRVSYTDQGKILFGEAGTMFPTDRVVRIQSLFDRAGIIYETPPDMIHALWWKFMINVGINQASAALRASYGVFQSSQEARQLMDSAMREVVALAQMEGVHLSDEDLKKWYMVLFKLNPEGKTSMLQDVEACRKTEVEMFACKVIELGRRHSVPTPVNENLLERIREIEASYKKGNSAGGE